MAAGITAVRSSKNYADGGTRIVRWLFRVHRWTGLIAGIPLAIILISGTLAVFKDEIDEFLNPALLVVQPKGAQISLEQAFSLVHSDARPVLSFYLPDKPHQPYLFYRRSTDKKTEQVTVDPYRGKVLGSRASSGHVADVLRQLHVRFYFFGATGRIVVVGAFGLLLSVSGITGLILYPRFLRAQNWRTVRWARGGQWVNSDLHKLFGITTLILNLLWAITGAVLGLENLTAYYRPAQKYLHPEPSVKASSSTRRLALDAAVSKAMDAIPGFVPHGVSMPMARDAPLVVYGNTGGAWTAPVSSWIALDAATGDVLQAHDERLAHAVTKLYNLHDPLHFGYFGGSVTRWLWLLAGAVVSVLPVTGLSIWWLKRRGRVAAVMRRS